jgi:hypothetical protein
MTHAPHFTAWLDRFFTSYYQHRPVNATFVGIHTADNRLPDYSAQGLAAARSAIESLQRELADLPVETLTKAEALDRRLAEGFLAIQRWEFASDHFGGGNPSFYAGEAAFGIISLLRRPFAPLAERLDAAAARADAIPTLLTQGQANLRHAPHSWTERARSECVGLRALLRRGLPQLLHSEQITHPALLATAERAAQAVDAFDTFLERELLKRESNEYACGEEAFALLLSQGHFLSQSAAEIAAYAEDTINTCAAELTRRAPVFGERDPKAVLAKLADIHPPVEHYYTRYGELWDACRALAEERMLVTWPDYPLRYTPRPAWSREAAAQLYFLFYHSPAPFDKLPEIDYLVTPVEPGMTDAEQLLRATNESVIKLNHVVHHGGLGHHVQNYYAFRAESRFGQMAAVDCASRIAMFCAGTMAEGWACYATDLMDEFGFLTPLESYAEHHSRLRMAARALADVRLHHGEWTVDQAASFYHDRVGMPAQSARSEAIKNTMFPGTALMYLMGTDSIHTLRRTLASRPGFTLRDFHDRLLSFGSVPVSLIAEAMMDDGR